MSGAGRKTSAGGSVMAVLGVGTMGAAMARNIGAAGLGLRVWNRSREAAAPAEAMDMTDGVLSDEAVWSQSCAVSPEGGRRLGRQAARPGIAYNVWAPANVEGRAESPALAEARGSGRSGRCRRRVQQTCLAGPAA